MNKQHLEDLIIRSLDDQLSSAEQTDLDNAIQHDSAAALSLTQHKQARQILRAEGTASFGPYFAYRIIHKIENAGIFIDREIFGVFRKFQLAVAGVVVALLILNIALSEQGNWKSILGLESENTPTQEQTAPFDFSETLNNL